MGREWVRSHPRFRFCKGASKHFSSCGGGWRDKRVFGKRAE